MLPNAEQESNSGAYDHLGPPGRDSRAVAVEVRVARTSHLMLA